MSYTASYKVFASEAQNTTDFTFTFPYIKEEHIEVYLNYQKLSQGSGSAQYQVITTSPTKIRLNTGLASANLRVEVRRNSSLGSPLVDYADGSTLTANDLDTSALQSLYIDQELKDNQGKTVSVDEDTGLPSMGESSAGNLRLTKVADPTAAQDAATKNYVDTKQFTSAQIQDGTIVDADINASAAISGSKLQLASGSNPGALSTSDFSKLGNIETAATADQTDAEIRTAVEAATDSNVFTDADHSKLNAIEANATADQTNAEIRAAVEAASDSNVFTDADHTKLNGIDTGAKDDQTAAEIKSLIATSPLDASHLAANSVGDSEITTGALDNRYYTETELNAGQLDNRYYTETEADARFYNLASGEEIQSGETWSAADNKIATTAAIDARITDLVDDVGGFVPIANETSFPAANPDVNNGAGTLVSVKGFTSSHTPSGGNVTIANGAGSGNTVTITGCGSTVLAAGFGGIVETTSTLHTYTFHRLTPKATEVTTVAGNISNINAVANNQSNINSAVSNQSNINAVVANATNINTVASNNSNITSVAGSLSGTQSYAVTVTNVGGSNYFFIDSVQAPALNLIKGFTYTFNVSASSNSGHPLRFKDSSGNSYTTGVTTSGTEGQAGATVTLAVASNAPSSLRYYCTAHGNGMGNTIATADSNIGTVAGSITNVNNVAGAISNVNTVGGAIANVNTVATNISGVNDFAARYRIASSAPGSNNDEGDLYFDTTSNELRVYNGSAWQGGVTATGNLAGLGTNTFTGAQTFVAGQTFDGRDVSADGTKLDGIETAATADQTNAEIRAAVEAAGDSNVFTDADHTKLNGIEASATADQTNAEIRAAVEAATDSNVFTDADHTKLDGIETAATADQTKSDIESLNINVNASNLNAGTIPDARFPATLPAASGANLTSLPAANLTGTLPAISGANLTNLPASGGAITATASGTLPNGQAVKINTNGTVSVAALAPPSWGNVTTPVTPAFFQGSCYVEDNKFLFCYYDSAATSAKAIVGEVAANGTITWGTPVVPQTWSNSMNQVAWDKDNNIGIYQSYSSGVFGIQFTISGLTPTFGTGRNYPIGSGHDSWNGVLIYAETYGKFAFFYNMYAQLRWFTWSCNTGNVNTAPSYVNGSSQSISGNENCQMAGCWNKDTNKYCVMYHSNNYYFYAQQFLPSGSSTASNGDPTGISGQQTSGFYYGNVQVAYDSANQKYLFGWADSSSRQYLRAATSSGSTWTKGTAITVTDSSDSNEVSIWGYNATPWLVWNSTSEEFTVMWGSTGKLKFKDPTISGTTVTRGTTYEYSTTLGTSASKAFLITSKDSSRWLALYPETNSLTKSISRQGTSTSISNDNYIGFSDGTFSNGQTATIQLPGTVVDGLSGLTTGSKYYVSGDGTVSLTDTYYTNITAGVALSSSTLLLK